ncbi:hypothetical protein [Natrinema longum]|uniref:Uncharacterized protein n=1 Tax=Natrinema longum TaxID=370324 RepID=A0A8A2U2V8_9EURY|nr:hypothetical protein [Natrinema longum]MBZ6495106.1 hypothetical protein [Natrinema longum]QSW83601.1 hypothetical protein J0X27_08890 [Natrinema longum]
MHRVPAAEQFHQSVEPAIAVDITGRIGRFGRSSGGSAIASGHCSYSTFGGVTDRPQSDGEPTLEDAYTSICLAVAGFQTREADERWAARTSAATVGLPLSAATTVATGLVEN